MRKWLSTWWALPIIIVLASALFTASIVTYKNLTTKPSAITSRAFTYECDTTRPDSIDCQQKQYAQAAAQKDMPIVFAELKTAYETTPSIKANCHQITHAIGREAAMRYGSIEAAYQHGDNFCWSGYYHGVMEAIVRDVGKENINNSITTICAETAASRPQSFYHFNCVHGLGHGIMAINGDELFSSLKICDKLSDTWQQQSCQGGVFMENIMASINAGNTGKYLKADDPLYPCTAVNNQYKTQCYLMQTSQALKVVNYDYAQVFRLCGTVGEYATTCYQSLGRDASGNSNSNIQQTVATCMLGPDEAAQANCFIGAVKDFISYYHSDQQANELCTALTASLQPICQDTKTEYYKTL
jgi:hypothetical protein